MQKFSKAFWRGWLRPSQRRSTPTPCPQDRASNSRISRWCQTVVRPTFENLPQHPQATYSPIVSYLCPTFLPISFGFSYPLLSLSPSPFFSFFPLLTMSTSKADAIPPPSHGHPHSSHTDSVLPEDKASTSSHPPPTDPDPTLHASKGGFSTPAASGSAELSNLKVSLRQALRQFPDFPSPGILFEDILPIFANPHLHDSLIRALELHVTQAFGQSQKPDVVVGLEARGFLFGPSLALRLGAAFVPVRKKGKLPGSCRTASFRKEYGEDFFQMQADGIKSGQRVIIVDDIIATGTSISDCHNYLDILV